MKILEAAWSHEHKKVLSFLNIIMLNSMSIQLYIVEVSYAD